MPLFVPHLLQLAMRLGEVSLAANSNKEGTPRRRLRGKTTPESSQRGRLPCAHSWAISWGAYIRGHVVSEHASRLITNFPTAIMARTAGDDESRDEEEDDPHDDDVPPLCPSVRDAEAILSVSEALAEGELVTASARAHAQALWRSGRVWRESDALSRPEASDTSGHRPALFEYKKLARAAGRSEQEQSLLSGSTTQPYGAMYQRGSVADIDFWLDSLTAPNAMQMDMLRHFAERVKREWAEGEAGSAATSESKPLFELLHGLPGAGKIAVIGWLKHFRGRPRLDAWHSIRMPRVHERNRGRDRGHGHTHMGQYRPTDVSRAEQAWRAAGHQQRVRAVPEPPMDHHWRGQYGFSGTLRAAP